MTREEVIKFLKSGCLTLACEYHVKNRCDDDYNVKEERMNEALKMAIADMEKQIPKKPNRHEEDIIGEYYSCPNCMNNELDDIFDNYCPRCGQALDWSEEDE